MAIVKKTAMDSDLSSGQHCLTLVGPEAPVLLVNQPNISFGAYGRTDSDVTAQEIYFKEKQQMAEYIMKNPLKSNTKPHRFLYG